MTEQDERTIYEWAGYEDVYNIDGSWLCREEVFDYDPKTGDCLGTVPCSASCPPLDMNFAFDVCVPRLRSEGFQVDFWTYEVYEVGGKPFGVRIHGYAKGDFAVFVRFSDVSLQEAFYTALLAYIKVATSR